MSFIDDALATASSMLNQPSVEGDSSTSESLVESKGEGSYLVRGRGGGRWSCVGDIVVGDIVVGDSVVGIALGIIDGNDVGGSVMKFVSEKFSPRHRPVHWKFSEQHLSLAWYMPSLVTYAGRRLGSSPHVSEEKSG
jgi:hypothetical protein